MTRKIIIAIGSFIVMSVGIFYFYSRELGIQPTSPLSAIPNNAAIIVKSRDFSNLWKQLSHTNLMWQEITQSPYFHQLDGNGKILDSLIYENEEMKEIFDGLPIWSSMHMLGGAKFEFLYVFALPLAEEQFGEILQKLSVVPQSSKKFEQTTVFSLQLKDYSKGALYCSLYRGLVMCSFSQSLVEDAIRQLNAKGEGLMENPTFSRVLNTSGEYVDANIYVQYEQLNKLMAATLNNDQQESFSALSHYADWASLDMTLKPNALMLNGFTSFNDSVTGFLSCFSGQKPQDMDVLSVIPAKASNILCFGISNFELFYQKFKNYLVKYSDRSQPNEWIAAMNERHGVDAEAELSAFMGNEFGTFYFKADNRQDLPDRKFVVLRCANFNRAKHFLGLLDGETTLLAEGGVEIHHIKDSDVTGNFFGETFGGYQESYYAALEPYIVFSNSEASMRAYISNYQNGTFITHDDNYMHFSENLSSHSSIYMYSNFSRSKDFYTSYAGDQLKEIIEMYQEMLGKFEAVAVQLDADKRDLFYQNIYCNYNPIVKKETKSLWETSLDTTIASKPYTVLNHYSKAKEIFVQDVANRVYLIDNKGNVLWNKQLEEPIVSEVYQIDVYKNNKLQLLFNTASQLHLIDRKGRNVENFPVKIKSGASSGLALIDYDQDKDYRILIPANNKRIYNYSAYGSLVKGWTFKKTDHVVTKPVQYHSLEGRDYIIAVDEAGEVYVLNRRGEARIQINEKLPVTPFDFFTEMHSDIMNCKLVTIDSIGNIVKLRLDDRKEHIDMGSLSGVISFEYRDINNDRNYEYIYLDRRGVKVFGQQKQTLFSVDFEQEVSGPLQYFSSLGKYGRIGTLNKEEKKISLYLDAGGLAPDFPLNGTTTFQIDDVNSDGINEVIVGMDNALVTYSLKK